MKLFGGSDQKPTARDRKVAEKWPGPWTGVYVEGSRVTSKKSASQYARRLAKEAGQHCDFPVIVLYRRPKQWMEIPGGVGYAGGKLKPHYDPIGGNSMWCMWPVSCDAGPFISSVEDLLQFPHIEYGLLHHSVREDTWEDGLLERFDQLQGVTDVMRINWA